MKKINLLLFSLVLLFSFSSVFVLGAECSSIPSDGIISLNYPNTPNEQPNGWTNKGAIWIPKEACGQYVTLVIALHGWRSFTSDANVYIGPNSDKGFDQIAQYYISQSKIDPIVIAAPMHDKGPKTTVFGSEYYDVNTHMYKIKDELNKFDITVKDIVLTGHSNALCANGLKNAVDGVLSSGIPLKLVAMFDGTCGSNINYANKILNPPLDLGDTIVVHVYQPEILSFPATYGHTASGLAVQGPNPSDLTNFPSYFTSAKKNSNGKWYDLVFNPGTNTPTCNSLSLPCDKSFSSLHGAIPSAGFQWILEQPFFSKTSPNAIVARGTPEATPLPLISALSPPSVSTASLNNIDDVWLTIVTTLRIDPALTGKIWDGASWVISSSGSYGRPSSTLIPSAGAATMASVFNGISIGTRVQPGCNCGGSCTNVCETNLVSLNDLSHFKWSSGSPRGTQKLKDALNAFYTRAQALGFQKQITITSAWRNTEVTGKESSWHYSGNAADLSISGLTLQERLILIRAAIETGFGEILHGTSNGANGLISEENKQLKCFWLKDHADHIHIALSNNRYSWEECIIQPLS